MNEATGEILAVIVTLNDCHNGQVLGGIEDPMEQVPTDGTYDHRHCDNEIDTTGASRGKFPTGVIMQQNRYES